MAPFVSVIMPVYNSKEYVASAIDSILNQTYDNFELILSDDGSSDGSEAICDHYAHTDNRVIVIHKENGGISDARNHAMKIARGKYIAFCDNDDTMLPQCLELAVKAGEESDAEIVRFRRNLEIVLDNHKSRTIVTEPYLAQLLELDSWGNYILMEKLCGTHGVWAGLFRRDFLERNHILFDTNARSGVEDAIFIAQCCTFAKAVMLIPDILYVWKRRIWRSTSCVTSEEAYNNRQYAMFRWAEEEKRIALRIKPAKEDLEKRKYDYLTFALAELGRVRFDRKKEMEVWKEIKSRFGVTKGKRTICFKSTKEKFTAWCIDTDHLRLYFAVRHGYDRICEALTGLTG